MLVLLSNMQITVSAFSFCHSSRTTPHMHPVRVDRTSKKKIVMHHLEAVRALKMETSSGSLQVFAKTLS